MKLTSSGLGPLSPNSSSTAAIDGSVGPAGRFHIRTSAPCGRRTRAISASARSSWNQWKASAAKTASTEASASGISCAVPASASASGQSATSRRRIASAGSTATTRPNLGRSNRVSLPVPAAASSTVASGGQCRDVRRPPAASRAGRARISSGQRSALPAGMLHVLANGTAAIMTTSSMPRLEARAEVGRKWCDHPRCARAARQGR